MVSGQASFSSLETMTQNHLRNPGMMASTTKHPRSSETSPVPSFWPEVCVCAMEQQQRRKRGVMADGALIQDEKGDEDGRMKRS